MLFGADLTQFVREGNTRGLFENKTVLSLLTGEPEWLLPLKDEVPEGWTVTGYPWDEIKDPKHKAFVDAYRAKYNDTPRLGSLLGYMIVYMIRDTIERAGSVETEALIKALEDAQVRHGHRPGHDARHRQPVHHGRLGRQARPEGRDRRHDRLDATSTAAASCTPKPR